MPKKAATLAAKNTNGTERRFRNASTNIATRIKGEGSARVGSATSTVTTALRGIAGRKDEAAKRVKRMLRDHKTGVVQMTVTPEMAGDWLAVNMGNRKLRDQRVVRLARILEADRWVPFNGDTIKFDSDGRLIDGQHRLAAVLVANKPIQTYVAFGITPEAFPSLDTNLVRSHRDVLFGAGEENERVLASVLNAMVRYLKFGRFDYTMGGATNDEILATLEACPGLRESAAEAMQLRKRLVGLTWGVAGVCLYLFRDKDANDAEDFFQRLKSGTGLTEDDPIYLLRERLARPSAHITNNNFKAGQEQGVLMFKAWNFFRRNEYIDPRRLRYSPGEALPELV